MNLFQYSCLSHSFFLSGTVTFIPLWHPVKTDLFPLYLEKQSLEYHLSDEIILCDVTVFLLPLHSGWTSKNMDDRDLDLKLQPSLYPPVPPEAAAFRPPFSPDKGWWVAVQSNLWHKYTPGTVGNCDFFCLLLHKRKTQKGRGKRGRICHFIR